MNIKLESRYRVKRNEDILADASGHERRRITKELMSTKLPFVIYFIDSLATTVNIFFSCFQFYLAV